MYDSGEYAGTRLTETLVRWQDKAVFVSNVDNEMMAHVVVMGTNESKLIHLDELNLKSPPLGFVNHQGNCFYLARRPMRNDWRQGVRPNSVRCLLTGSGRVDLHVISTCINGTYPTVMEAVKATKEQGGMVAISRDFSLRRSRVQVHVHYKWYGKVGVLKSGKVTLEKGFTHLEEELGGLL